MANDVDLTKLGGNAKGFLGVGSPHHCELARDQWDWCDASFADGHGSFV